MNYQQSICKKITETVTSWPGIKAGHGRRGEFSFKVGRREIGHLHGNHMAHFGFPEEVGTRLREQGRVGPHPVNPDSPKLAARTIRNDSDIQDVIQILRMNYDRIISQYGLPDTTEKKNQRN